MVFSGFDSYILSNLYGSLILRFYNSEPDSSKGDVFLLA